jgi:hypothetical protein
MFWLRPPNPAQKSSVLSAMSGSDVQLQSRKRFGDEMALKAVTKGVQAHMSTR